MVVAFRTLDRLLLKKTYYLCYNDLVNWKQLVLQLQANNNKSKIS